MTVWHTEHALSTLENQCSVVWNVIGLPRKKSCLMPINHGKWISEVAKVNFKFKHHYFNIYGANRINAWIYPDHQGNKFRVNAVWKVQKKTICPLLNNYYFIFEFHSNTKRDFISENHFFGMPTLCHMIIHHWNWWFHSYKQCSSRSGAFLMWYSRCALVANKNGDHI